MPSLALAKSRRTFLCVFRNLLNLDWEYTSDRIFVYFSSIFRCVEQLIAAKYRRYDLYIPTVSLYESLNHSDF